MTAIIAGVGALVAIMIIAGLAYLYMAKHPLATAFALIGMAMGLAVGTQLSAKERAQTPAKGNPVAAQAGAPPEHLNGEGS